eukprot:scaffold100656_cov32-Attheya_sp.AAC.3
MPPQQNADGPPTKRRKSFAAIVAADKDEALRELRNAAKFIIDTQTDTPTSDYCVPNQMMTTWRGDAMREQLIELRDDVCPNLKKIQRTTETRSRHWYLSWLRLRKNTCNCGSTHVAEW